MPDWQVKTPLQRAIQILKRHRDIYFQSNLDERPVSIIITTLAALAYNNQANVYEAIVDILSDMARYIDSRNGRWRIVNPVDPNENFADKWNEYPKRREAFERWQKKAREDFFIAPKMQTFSKSVESLSPVLGQRIMAKAASDLGVNLGVGTSVPATYQVTVPALGDTSHSKVPAWPINTLYKVNVVGTVHYKEKGKKLWQLTERALPKNVWLKFTASTNAPAPYDVRWQVVNTGKEAADAGSGQLRGDFYESDSQHPRLRWERTAYKGTHWVEAFIIKNGVCIARSGRKFVKIR